MYAIVWEFRASPGHETEFEQVYGPEGAWARLFARGAGFLGTELLGDADERGRYLTIDRWTSRAAFEAFRQRWDEEYRALDGQCAAMRLHETPLGSFTPP